MDQESTPKLPLPIEFIAKGIGLVGVILYIAGFMIINSYLSQFGLFDYNVVSSRFVFAGASFCLILAIWWTVSGRLQIFSEDRKDINLDLFSTPWRVVSFIAQAMTVLARTALAAGVIKFLMFDDGIIALPAAILIAFLIFIDKILSINRSGSLKSSKIFCLVSSLINLSACVLFFVMLRGKSNAIAIFNTLTLMEGTLFAIYNLVKENQIKDIKPLNSIIFQSVVFITILVGFGRQYYGKISFEYGGGATRNVEITLKDPLRISNISTSDMNIIKGKIIYLNEKTIILEIEKSIISINSDQIKAMVIASHDKTYEFYEAVKTLRRIGLKWKPEISHLSK